MDLSAPTWRESSRSSGGGNACVEIAAIPDTALWRKSTYSGGGGNNCIEVAAHRSSIAIRDSKDPDGGVLLLHAEAFRRLTACVKHGDYDR